MKTVITYGTFDTFHYGHLELLTRAARLGDRLFVGVSTDKFNQLKGKKCMFSYSKRVEWLSYIKVVDTFFEENSWEQKEYDIQKYNASVLVMGDDWAGKFDSLNSICDVVYLKRTENISTTEIKNLQSR